MQDGEQEYPPGTVGYLAQGRGWPRTGAVRAQVENGEPVEAAGPGLREPRLATPVPEPEAPEAVVDVHTDEDDDEQPLTAPAAVPVAQAPPGSPDTATPPNGTAAAVPAGHRPSIFDVPDDPVDIDPIDDLLADPADPPAGPEAVAESWPVSDLHTLPGPTGTNGTRLGVGPLTGHPAAPGPLTGHPATGHPAAPGPAAPPPVPATRSGGHQAAPGGRPAARWVEPGALAAEQAQQARLAEPTDDLASARLLRDGKRPPRSGWRKWVYLLSGRLINPGEGPADQNERDLIARVNHPLHGCYRIAMLSLKGGVGKTTVTATLGATFASLRGDRVIAVDANPDRGTLSQKIPLETSATVRHLLRDAQRVRRYTDVRAYTSQGSSRLEVLASEQDPAVSEAFSEIEYRRTVNLLEHFYNLVLTDCGTGLMHSAMYGVLGLADSLVIVSSGSIDGARSASATMDWLDAHGHRDLVSNSVAVINSVRRSSGGVDLDRVAEHFAARCRAVVRIPYDPHLEEGAEIDLDRLSHHTRMALLGLAAAVADGFPANPRPGPAGSPL